MSSLFFNDTVFPDSLHSTKVFALGEKWRLRELFFKEASAKLKWKVSVWIITGWQDCDLGRPGILTCIGKILLPWHFTMEPPTPLIFLLYSVKGRGWLRYCLSLSHTFMLVTSND